MHKLSMSCSSSKQHWTHDVFLSFRGWDTRWGFISHLYTALKRVGITTYVDEKIEKGEALWPAISRAIEGSKISIVILSRNYATSRWCLSELEKIMQCRETTGQLVVPIFYDVHPRDVRHQRGDFGLCFDELAAKFSGLEETHTVFAWRNALTRIADLSGWHLERSRSESEIVDAIVGDVFEKLDISYLQVTDYPVGLESRVQDVIQFLESTSSTGVRMVGIWGMGGSGKTTIAKVIYNTIHRNFGNKSFIANIREVWEKGIAGQTDLQEQLLSDILKVEKAENT